MEQWSLFEPASDKSITRVPVTNTSSQFILGGPNILKPPEPFKDENGEVVLLVIHYFRRVYTELPPHNSLTITGRLWYFGYPRGTRGLGVTIYVNPPIQKTEKPILNLGREINEISETEFSLHNLKFWTSHNMLSLDLGIYIQGRDTGLENLSFGFRELTIHFSNSTVERQLLISSCPTEVVKSRSKRQIMDSCSCPLNQALDENAVCKNCSSNCDVCLGPSPEECLSCSPGSHWTGLKCTTCHWNCKTCTGLTQHECSVCSFGFYNYGNGSCLKTCEWPFKPVSAEDELQCVQACPGEYPWNYLLQKQCLEECEPPLLQVVEGNHVMACETPCHDLRDYLYTNRSCIPTCPSPLLAEFNYGIKFCKNPCGGTSQYLYWNRSCLESCPAPLQIKSEPFVKYCVNPCSSGQQYLYNNGSCHSNCRSPMRVKIDSGGIKYCLSPCDLEKEYILKDGSCRDECPAPLVKKLEPGVGTHCLSPCESDDYFVTNNNRNGSSLCLLSCPDFFDVEIKYGVKYCLNPCSSDQYYFEQNKTCLDMCPYPLKARSEVVANFCQNPCSASDDFIYDDQSCHKSCPLPLVNLTETRSGANHCKSPCDSENRKYLIVDGSCQENCEYPYKIVKKGSYQICQIGVSKSQVRQVDSMRQTVKMSKTVSEIGGLLGCLINAGDPTSIFMMPLLHMLETIKYTEITLPVNIGLILNQDQSMRILKEATSELGENFDHDLFIMGIVCLLSLLLIEVKALIKPRSGSIMALILEQSTIALQWNVSAAVLISINGDALLYLLAVFKNSRLDEIYKSLRTLVCLAVPLLTFFVIYKILRVSSEVKSIRDRHLNEGQEQYLEASLSGLQRWKFIFEIYKSETLSQRLFVLIYIIRVVLMNFVLSCFSQYPLVQAVLMVSMSFGTLLYLLWASPIQKTSSYIQHIAIEISLLLYNILFVILAVQENDQNLGVIGQLMMILYLITPITTAIIILIKLLMRIYYLSRKYGASTGSPSARGIIQLGEASNRNEEGEMSFSNDDRIEQQQQENIVEVISFETNHD